MSDPFWPLVRALIERAGGAAELIEAKAWDWASATFVGQRHLLRLACEAPAAVRLCDRIETAAIAPPGWFLREVGVARCDGGVEITMLVVADA